MREGADHIPAFLPSRNDTPVRSRAELAPPTKLRPSLLLIYPFPSLFSTHIPLSSRRSGCDKDFEYPTEPPLSLTRCSPHEKGSCCCLLSPPHTPVFLHVSCVAMGLFCFLVKQVVEENRESSPLDVPPPHLHLQTKGIEFNPSRTPIESYVPRERRNSPRRPGPPPLPTPPSST